MRNRARSLLFALMLAPLLIGAGRAGAAPVPWAPISVAVTDFECLNRDGRGNPEQNGRFFADLLVQALRSGEGNRVEYVPAQPREALNDPRVYKHHLSLGGDYVELLNGNYQINVRLYEPGSRGVLRVWSEVAPTWRAAHFTGKEEASRPAADAPALKRLAEQVSVAVREIQVWRSVRDWRAPAAGIKAAVRSDKERYAVLDPVSLTVTPAADAYVTVLSLGSTGEARVLFPRPKEESPRVRKNDTLQFPGPGWVFRVTDQVGFGEDVFKVILTKRPLRLKGAVLEPSRGDTAACTRLLETVAEELGRLPDDAWGEASCIIRVSEKRK